MRMHPMLEGLTDLTPRATDDENPPALAPPLGLPSALRKAGSQVSKPNPFCQLTSNHVPAD